MEVSKSDEESRGSGDLTVVVPVVETVTVLTTFGATTVTVEAPPVPTAVEVVVLVAKKVVRDVHCTPTGNCAPEPPFWRALRALPDSGRAGRWYLILVSRETWGSRLSSRGLRFLAEKPGESARAVKPAGAATVRVMPATKVVLSTVVAVVKLWVLVKVCV